MNQKEINELRRRFRPEKSAISRVYGCYVNSSKEIVSDLDESDRKSTRLNSSHSSQSRMPSSA